MSVASMKRPATIADLLAIPEPERFHEIIGGELVQKATPSAAHGSSQANLTGRLVGQYGRRSGGGFPGGWRFMTETEIQFAEGEVYRPHVAGWRRERMPTLPKESPLTTLPDWVAEIVSPSNERNDIIKKMLTYQRCRVPHYWLIDPILEALVVYRFTESGYLLAQSASGTSGSSPSLSPRSRSPCETSSTERPATIDDLAQSGNATMHTPVLPLPVWEQKPGPNTWQGVSQGAKQAAWKAAS